MQIIYFLSSCAQTLQYQSNVFLFSVLAETEDANQGPPVWPLIVLSDEPEMFVISMVRFSRGVLPSCNMKPSCSLTNGNKSICSLQKGRMRFSDDQTTEFSTESFEGSEEIMSAFCVQNFTACCWSTCPQNFCVVN